MIKRTLDYLGLYEGDQLKKCCIEYAETCVRCKYMFCPGCDYLSNCDDCGWICSDCDVVNTCQTCDVSACLRCNEDEEVFNVTCCNMKCVDCNDDHVMECENCEIITCNECENTCIYEIDEMFVCTVCMRDNICLSFYESRINLIARAA